MTGNSVRGSTSQSQCVSELLGRLDLGGQNWCYVEIGPSGGFGVPPSDAVFFHAILHGSARLSGVSGGTTTLRAGEVAIILSGEAHALRNRPDSPASSLDFLREDRIVDIPPTMAIGGPGPVTTRILSGRLTVTWPSGLGRASFPSLLRLDTSDMTSPAALLRPEAIQMAGFGAGSAAMLTRIASLMLVAALRRDPRCLSLAGSPAQDPIQQALRLVAANPSTPWTVERLARTVGMGRSNFAAQFTAQIGRAPMDFVTEQRMSHAANLLRESRLKIAEIGELAGYQSEAAFSRRVTRYFGMSPRQLREQARTEQPIAAQRQEWQPLLAGRRLMDNAGHARGKNGGNAVVLGRR